MAATVRKHGGADSEWLVPALSLVTSAGLLVLSLFWSQWFLPARGPHDSKKPG